MANYQRKRDCVQAIRLAEPVYNRKGKKLASKGDWLLIDDDQQRYMTDEVFRAQYEPVPTWPNYGYSWYSTNIEPTISSPQPIYTIDPGYTGDQPADWSQPKIIC